MMCPETSAPMFDLTANNTPFSAKKSYPDTCNLGAKLEHTGTPPRRSSLDSQRHVRFVGEGRQSSPVTRVEYTFSRTSLASEYFSSYWWSREEQKCLIMQAKRDCMMERQAANTSQGGVVNVEETYDGLKDMFESSPDKILEDIQAMVQHPNIYSGRLMEWARHNAEDFGRGSLRGLERVASKKMQCGRKTDAQNMRLAILRKYRDPVMLDDRRIGQPAKEGYYVQAAVSVVFARLFGYVDAVVAHSVYQEKHI